MHQHEQNENIWASHAIKFLEMAFRTDRQESLHHADGRGKKATSCGDSIEFFLIIKDGIIETISYAHKGCMNTNACANAVIDLIEGKCVEVAWRLGPKAVSAYLESLPENHFHCAELAIDALNLALSDARDKQKSPWKKLYQ